MTGPPVSALPQHGPQQTTTNNHNRGPDDLGLDVDLDLSSGHLATPNGFPRERSASRERGGGGGDEDDDEIRRVINESINNPLAFRFEEGEGQEKADDAVDYEDIDDDDDLPEEEEPSRPSYVNGSGRRSAGNDDGYGDEDDDDGLGKLMTEATRAVDDDQAVHDDDLFGDSSLDFLPGNAEAQLNTLGEDDNDDDDEDSKETLRNNIPELQSGFQLHLDELPDADPIDRMFQDMEYPEDAHDFNPPTQLERVRQLFPAFEPGKILSFPQLFPPKPSYYGANLPHPPKTLQPSKLSLELSQDQERAFRSHAKLTAPIGNARIVNVDLPVSSDSSDAESETEDTDPIEQSLEKNVEIACAAWNVDEELATPFHEEVATSFDEDRPVKRQKLSSLYLDPTPKSWQDSDDPYNGTLEASVKPLLDLNDSRLLLEVHEVSEGRRRIGGEFRRQRINKNLSQRYNISNDEAYNLLKENHQSKVRSTIGQLNMEHTMPALRLQTPYYRTKLSKTEARAFHRPTLSFTPDAEIRFTRIKLRKKKHMRGKEIKGIFDTAKSLSLADGSNFVLMEYSEEHPYVLSNFGMASRIINYYRRKTNDDESRPKNELGELNVLTSQDRSPFWNFGSVPPGETVAALYNRMVRAPIFKHTAKPTDFLVVRNSDAGGAYYYMRNIPHIYVVGQVFPVTDVPGPHSRKVTTASKNRLRMVCYRVLRRKENHRISVKDISQHFPENNDMQSRQKMKEFMSYQKEKERGFWQMKSGETIPDESTIRSMISPETVCLLDAMQVGLRYLEDAGYSRNAIDDDDGDEEKDGMSVEQQLAPWIATRNFINATQGKAMLKLHGEGDPTGRGEAFSFVRTSMKGGFKAIGESVDEKLDQAKLKSLGGHSYNVARQQKAYEEAIDQIWKAQQRSLSSVEEQDDLDMEDASRDDGHDELFEDGRTPRSEAMTPAGWGNNLLDDETTSQFSRFSATNTRNKVLRISRDVRNADGTIERKTELITDSKVIRMYLRRKHEIEEETLTLETLVPTGNEDQDKRSKKLLQAELQRLKKNKERREARERQGGKKVANPATPNLDIPSPSGLQGQKQGTTRKCANCGLTGHIKTNKKLCPAFNGGISKPSESANDASAPSPMPVA